MNGVEKHFLEGEYRGIWFVVEVWSLPKTRTLFVQSVDVDGFPRRSIEKAQQQAPTIELAFELGEAVARELIDSA